MCLDTIHKRTQKFTEGYKVFEKGLRGGAYPWIIDNGSDKPYRKGRWIKSKKRILRINEVEYESGFHFYKYLKDARKMTSCKSYLQIYKIKVLNIIATGRQDRMIVGVAEKMMILDKIK